MFMVIKIVCVSYKKLSVVAHLPVTSWCYDAKASDIDRQVNNNCSNSSNRFVAATALRVIVCRKWAISIDAGHVAQASTCSSFVIQKNDNVYNAAEESHFFFFRVKKILKK